jgi:hypothetical protein
VSTPLASHEAGAGEVQVAAIATEIFSSGPIASGVLEEEHSEVLLMDDDPGWLSSADSGVQMELEPDDELFNVVRIDDLPPELRERAAAHGFSSRLYEGVAGNVDGVMLWSANIDALLLIDGTTYQQRGADLELNIEPSAPAEPATTSVQATVLRFPSRDAADRMFQQQTPEEGEIRLALRGFDGGNDFDLAEAIRDSERTYSERRRESIDIAGLGDHAYGEEIAVAVLDYDQVANEYRSDRVLSWQHTETVSFVVGQYAVLLSRSAVSLDDQVPGDVDLVALASGAAERLRDLEIVP